MIMKKEEIWIQYILIQSYMSNKGFTFYPEDISYEEIEQFCKEKWFEIIFPEAIKNDMSYPLRIKNYLDKKAFFIDKYIYIY